MAERGKILAELVGENSDRIIAELGPRDKLIRTYEKQAMELGKLLILLGFALVLAGAAAMLLGRMNLNLERLPGDFLYRGKNTTVYFPLATSVVVSVVLSLVLYLVSRWRR